MSTLKLGDGVKRVNTAKDDRSTGRKGNVISIDGTRAQVQWLYEENGSIVINSSNGYGVKTWVKIKTLLAYSSPIDPTPGKKIFDEYKAGRSTKYVGQIIDDQSNKDL